MTSPPPTELTPDQVAALLSPTAVSRDELVRARADWLADDVADLVRLLGA